MMEWLKALGVAGFLFFLIKGLLWLVVFYLISRGIIQKSAVEQAKLRLRRLFRFQRP
jgi:energy-converting hydrogenase Eha subunit G